MNRITHTCKNITLATTSLRPVKTDGLIQYGVISDNIDLIKNKYTNINLTLQ